MKKYFVKKRINIKEERKIKEIKANQEAMDVRFSNVQTRLQESSRVL